MPSGAVAKKMINFFNRQHDLGFFLDKMKERAVTPLVVVDKPRMDEVMALPARDDRERLSSTNPRVQSRAEVHPRGPARRAQRGGHVRLVSAKRAPLVIGT